MEKYRRRREIGRNSHIKRSLDKLGVSLDEYKRLKEKGCALCGGFIKLCIDHDHEIGKFRGILCVRCNSYLGYFGDTVESFMKIINYLGGDTPCAF